MNDSDSLILCPDFSAPTAPLPHRPGEKKPVDFVFPLCYKVASLHGAIAQLGERLNGIQEVDGSIPSSSTKNDQGLTLQGQPFFRST